MAVTRRWLTIISIVTALSAAAPVALAATDAEQQFLSQINDARDSRGLDPLRVDERLVSHARRHSHEMQELGRLSHSTESELIAAAGEGWQRIGENVGKGRTPTSLHEAFMASPDHRGNILGDYDYVGVGTDQGGGYLYVTVVFVKREDASSAGSSTSGDRFVDDEGNIHEAGIEAIADRGITYGCNPPENSHYCPRAPVSRGEMAAFIARALGLPDTDTDHFQDDEGSIFESAIDRLADAGITAGCNPPVNTRFCPERNMTRGEMAAFLVRAFGLPETPTDRFSDDQGHLFEEAINRLAAAGITMGCNPPANTSFCPDDPVRRDQMATFLHRAMQP